MKNMHEKLEKYEIQLKNLRDYFELPVEIKIEPPKIVKNYNF